MTWLKRHWPKVGLLLLTLLILWFNRAQLWSLLQILQDRQAITAYLEPLGVWGPLLYLVIMTGQVLTAVIPGHALMIAAGYVYGFSGGLLLNLIGAIGASQLAFLVGRLAGKPTVQRFVPEHLLERWHSVANQRGFFFFVICFWFPVIPSNATNYIGGLTSISAWLFFLANLVGRLPGVTIITLLGSHGIELTWQQWAIIAVIGVIVVIGGRYLSNKLERKFTAS